ncbi:MAG: hypothetical protein LBO78_01440 [Rickettsiales bacterium]|nr:hypothetical protein [Rickettsiales bacterium]
MMAMKHRDTGGSILMEVLLMLGILVVVFPIIQKNVQERSDALRNELVVKDMMKIKTALENYLEDRTEEDVGVTEYSDLSFLYKTGLPQGFKTSNIIGQNYKVRIKRSKLSDGTIEYDAIVIADGNPNISDLRIREIVKESRGFGGYVEDKIIYGANWSLAKDAWEDGVGAIQNDSIIFKTGANKKRDYQYISRVSEKSNAMNTDLHMNLNDIYNAGLFEVTNKMEVNELSVDASATSEFDRMSLEDTATFNSAMTVAGANSSVSLPEGIDNGSLFFDDDRTEKVFLEELMKIGGDFEASATVIVEPNVLRFAKAATLVGSGTELKIGNQLKLPSDATSSIGTMTVADVTIDASSKLDGAENFGFTSDGITSRKNAKFKMAGGSFSGHDVIVKNVNSALAGKKIGGIDITTRTPISVVLRAISYEYADLYRLVHNDYPSESEKPIPGWSYPEQFRCFSEDCDGQYWWDKP